MDKQSFIRQALRTVAKGKPEKALTAAEQLAAREAALLAQKTPTGHRRFMRIPRTAYTAGATTPAQKEVGKEVAEGMTRARKAREAEELLSLGETLSKGKTIGGFAPGSLSPFQASRAVKAVEQAPFVGGATIVQPKGTMFMKRGSFEQGFREELQKIAAFTRPSFVRTELPRSLLNSLGKNYAALADDLARLEKAKRREAALTKKVQDAGLPGLVTVSKRNEALVERAIKPVREARREYDELLSSIPHLRAR